MESRPQSRYTVLIASPLEPELVQRIAEAEPDRLRVIFEPDLLPEPRYPADHAGIPRELSTVQSARWADLLAEADILFDFDWMSPELLQQRAPKLRWIQATSAGIGEFVAANGLGESDIIFTTASGVHAVPLAEFVMTGLLYFLRGLPDLQSQKAERNWTRHAAVEAASQRVLIVGLGSVGRMIARYCQHIGIETWGYQGSSTAPIPDEISRLIPSGDLLDALPGIDALILSCPLIKETQHLIGASELNALRSTAILINVSRGPVVDEPALVEALDLNRIAGAVLDVFETEPLPQNSPLWDMPNVLISPHSAGTVAAENERIVEIFLDNIDRFLRGSPLRNEFGRSRGY